MNREKKISYLRELAQNLRHGGFTAGPETENGLLPVDLEGQRLFSFCLFGSLAEMMDPSRRPPAGTDRRKTKPHKKPPREREKTRSGS